MKEAPGTLHTPLRLFIRKERLVVCRLSPYQKVPSWATEAEFFSLTRTPDELSIVCPGSFVPAGTACKRGLRALGIVGPLDFSLVGVLATITELLAEADISVFVISTYDTDYVLVSDDALETAVAALRGSGHEVRDALPDIIVRPAVKDDEPFLWEMLYESVHWGPEESGPKPPPEELLAEPGLRRYLAGWGREGDFALVAQDAEDDRKVGAAWYRLFPGSDPGYGFVDAATPNIAIAVAPERRGTGVGRTLLRALMDAASSEGYGALSLSVQKSNHAAARLYERNGFVRHSDDGNAWVMKAELSADATTNEAHGAH